MKIRTALLLILPALFGALLITGCDSASPVAPNGTVITLTANPTQISINGTSTITVTGFRPDGNPLNPGTQITLSTNLGDIPAVVVADSQGRATAVLTADDRTGEATVTARLTSGEGEATVAVQVGENDTTQPALTINVSPSEINVEQESVVSVLVRNPDQTPRAGETVRLRTTLGRLGRTTLTTNANGEAQTLLHPDDSPGGTVRSGAAEITGTAGSSADASPVTVTILRTEVDLTLNPSTIDVGEAATLTVLVRDENNIPLVGGHEVQLTSELGTFGSNGATSTVVTTDSSGRAFVDYTAGDQAGNDTINAFVDNSDGANTSVEIRDAPASFDFNVTPRFVNAGADNTLSMTATVVNNDGIALAGVLVRFNSDVGGTFNPTPPNVTTTNSGVASATVTYNASDLPAAGSTFRVSATVRIAGEDTTQQLTIEVR